eukprot:SAG22_NODE_1594_length_4038_cov_3.494034_2_plen_125_part_00
MLAAGDQIAQHWTIGSTIADGCNNCLAERNTPQAPDTSVQLWAKPQPGNAVAVLLINNSPHEQYFPLSLDESTLGSAAHAARKWRARDIWERQDVGVFEGSFAPVPVPAYDSGFYLLTPVVVET